LPNSCCEIIGALERQWRDALCAKDMDQLRKLVHPRFTLIATRSSGPFSMSRDEWLEAIEKRQLVSIELAIIDAAVFDQVMIGTIEAKWRVKYLGRQVEDCVMLTDVWVREDDDWRVIRRHSSPLPGDLCSAR
jgi:ketosteroid isomerase-like protein